MKEFIIAYFGEVILFPVIVLVVFSLIKFFVISKRYGDNNY